MKKLAAGILMMVCLAAGAGTAFAGIHGAGISGHHGVHRMERSVCSQGCWVDANGDGVCDNYAAGSYGACRDRSWAYGDCGAGSGQHGHGWGRGCR